MEKNILIDFHAHILPGMDHGCEDVSMSMEQIRMAAAHNIGLIIATSHFYPHADSVDNFLKRREAAFQRLKAAKQEDSPDIKLGAEVLLCGNIDKMKGIEALCIENSRVLLLEMPFMKRWDNKLITTVVRLRDEKGLEVILAHGERYPGRELMRLLDKGFQLQVNVSSLTKLIPSGAAKRYIKGHCVSALGSDIHGLGDNYKDYDKFMRKSRAQAEDIMKKTRMLLNLV
jgi:protein-tyrosine phosphatase